MKPLLRVAPLLNLTNIKKNKRPQNLGPLLYKQAIIHIIYDYRKLRITNTLFIFFIRIG